MKEISAGEGFQGGRHHSVKSDTEKRKTESNVVMAGMLSEEGKSVIFIFVVLCYL